MREIVIHLVGDCCVVCGKEAKDLFTVFGTGEMFCRDCDRAGLCEDLKEDSNSNYGKMVSIRRGCV